MHISIVTIGTRGDVQPYIALGVQLQARGHRVTICTHTTFKTFVESYGVGFMPLEGDIRAMLESEAGKRLLAMRNPIQKVRGMTALAAPILRQMAQDIIEATRGVDLILGSTLGYFNAITAAQVHQVPLYLATFQCFSPTSAFPSITLPILPMGVPLRGLYNQLSYRITNRLLYGATGNLLNQIRQDLTGLPPLGYDDYFGALLHMRHPVIYAYSEAVLPRPDEWNQNIHISGFWFLDQQSHWQPPTELTDFLAAGEPPVYVGFGSMSDREPEQVGRIVIDALRQTGQRGILLSGWEGLKVQQLPDTILLLDNVPHDWLFPRVAAAVHHGGIGTTSAVLRAGIPQVIVPFSSDQPFWGYQMHQLGVAPRAIPRKQLTADRLAMAIKEAVANPNIKRTATCIGERIRSENGVLRAAEVIEQLAKS